jgi:L-ribulose-5-phosphate 3-epimerase
MVQSRRQFVENAALLGATAAIGAALPQSIAAAAPTAPAAATSPKHVKLAVATYSWWHFRDPKVPVSTVIDKAAALGVEGVDVLHRQMDSDDRAYLRKLKRQAFVNGVALVNLSIHQGFVYAEAEERQKNIDHTIKCIEMAYEMGIPCMRLNTGRWNTTKSFDDLMKARGIEPILPGHTEEEGFKWCIDCIEKVLPKAEECGVVLALENHWGLARTPEGQLRILNAIDSPFFGGLMDTGNFLEDPYEKLKLIAPKTVFVQAKTYYGGGEWYALDLDYKRIAKMLADVNYKGYVALEFEGKEDPDVAVPKSLQLLREAFTT